LNDCAGCALFGASAGAGEEGNLAEAGWALLLRESPGPNPNPWFSDSGVCKTLECNCEYEREATEGEGEDANADDDDNALIMGDGIAELAEVGVGDGVNEDTCKRIANSSVELVSLTMFMRKAEELVPP